MIDKNELTKLNDDIYEKARVDREHLLKFLTLIPTSDARVVAAEVRTWLKGLNDDPKYDQVSFPQGDIDAILTDLASYERLSPETLYALQQPSNRELRA
jgi:hypothetical protein